MPLMDVHHIIKFKIAKWSIYILPKVLEGIRSGKSNKEIGATLFISVNTVKYHVKNIYEKLDINNRKEVVEKLK